MESTGKTVKPLTLNQNYEAASNQKNCLRLTLLKGVGSSITLLSVFLNSPFGQL
jgi:hypothetical protein